MTERVVARTRPSRQQYVVTAATAAGVIALDQLSKWWAINNLNDHVVDVVWTLRLHLVFNSGAAFSLATGIGPFIALLAVGVVGFLIWSGRSVTTTVGAVAIGLVLGGAIGNLVDRLFRAGGNGVLGGRVVDFIDFQWWPVFNVADMGVVIGAILLVMVSWKEGREVP
jgi:signal peptidase II